VRLKIIAEIVDMAGDYSILTSDYRTSEDLRSQTADRQIITVFQLGIIGLFEIFAIQIPDMV
jgi:hypothetical protein